MGFSEADISNREFHETANAKKVILVDGSGTVISGLDFNLIYTQAIENNSSGQPIYLGLAAPGTAKSASGWLIKKITYSNNVPTDVQFAESENTFDKTWDDRGGYSYG